MKISAVDVDKVIYGCIQNNYSVQHYGIWADPDTNTFKIISSRSQDITYNANESDIGGRATVIVEYTKKSDAPNSFSMDVLLQQYNFNSNIENIVLDEYCSPDDVEEVLG